MMPSHFVLVLFFLFVECLNSQGNEDTSDFVAQRIGALNLKLCCHFGLKPSMVVETDGDEERSVVVWLFLVVVRIWELGLRM